MSETLLHGLDYVVEGLTLASVGLIWWPAYKVSRLLRTAKKMDDLRDSTEAENAKRIAAMIGAAARKAPGEFNGRDYQMLWWGFFAVRSHLQLNCWF